MQAAIILWDDATSCLTGVQEQDVPKLDAPCLTLTAGILIRETADHYILATDYRIPQNEYFAIHTIPKGMVKQITLHPIKKCPKSSR